jgi:hypothetical protein
VQRVWGRVADLQGNLTWQQVTTDANGFNDLVNIVWLQQALKLNLGESPFYADWGIPAHVSAVTQVAPDYYANLTQQRFAGLFASLTISRTQGVRAPSPSVAPPPTYQVNIITHQGATLPPIQVPTAIPG